MISVIRRFESLTAIAASDSGAQGQVSGHPGQLCAPYLRKSPQARNLQTVRSMLTLAESVPKYRGSHIARKGPARNFFLAGERSLDAVLSDRLVARNGKRQTDH
jgi:hypothetical protein